MRDRLSTFFIIFMFTCFLPVVAFCSDDLHYKCLLSSNFPLSGSKEKKIFSPHEKIYIYVKFSELPPGEYNFNTAWLKYNGEVELYKSSKLKIDYATDYIYYSWFELTPKGTLKRMVSGGEYDFEQRGNRVVTVELNGEQLCKCEFEIL